jgi:predicted MFS family arabinose efflux permease
MTTTQDVTLSRMQNQAYRGWVLGLLMLVALFGFADRQITAALAQPIKRDLGLTDTQLGLLSGFAFASLNAVATIPIARIADRGRRLTLISIGIFIWSGATALCGLAQGFIQLVGARLCVGMGEATGAPATTSVIADYYPPAQRASAAGIFALAIPLGALLGAAGGGFIAQHANWRMAFVIAGLPGLLLGLLVATTVREPIRGHYDARPAQADAPPLLAVLRRMLDKPAFLHTVLGSTLVSTGGFGIITFHAPYFFRRFGLDFAEAGLLTGLIGAIPGTFCILASGFLADRLGKRDVRYYGWVPAAGAFAAAPLYILSFLQGGWVTTTAMLLVTGLFQYSYLPVAAGVYQNLMEPRMRASATAVVNVATNLVSASLGPLLVGALSDGLAARAFRGAGDFGACVGKAAIQTPACASASATGLQWACMVFALMYLWGGVHFLLAARTMRRDMADSALLAPAE